jgi:hypothetical protein
MDLIRSLDFAPGTWADRPKTFKTPRFLQRVKIFPVLIANAIQRE